MIVTRDAQLAELLRCMRAHGWTRDLKGRRQVEELYPEIDPNFLFVNTGFNVRPSEINAAWDSSSCKNSTASIGDETKSHRSGLAAFDH